MMEVLINKTFAKADEVTIATDGAIFRITEECGSLSIQALYEGRNGNTVNEDLFLELGNTDED